jgi:hypothetical protein
VSNQTFLTILSATSSAVAAAMAGIVLLPVDDVYKAFGVFGLSIVSTFLTGLLKPPTGPMVARNPRAKKS